MGLNPLSHYATDQAFSFAHCHAQSRTRGTFISRVPRFIAAIPRMVGIGALGRQRCERLEAVSRRQPSMCVTGAFVRRASRVAAEHRARFPAGETHQVTLRTAAC
jgi:hypothetical protein